MPTHTTEKHYCGVRLLPRQPFLRRVEYVGIVRANWWLGEFSLTVSAGSTRYRGIYVGDSMVPDRTMRSRSNMCVRAIDCSLVLPPPFVSVARRNGGGYRRRSCVRQPPCRTVSLFNLHSCRTPSIFTLINACSHQLINSGRRMVFAATNQTVVGLPAFDHFAFSRRRRGETKSTLFSVNPKTLPLGVWTQSVKSEQPSVLERSLPVLVLEGSAHHLALRMKVRVRYGRKPTGAVRTRVGTLELVLDILNT